jgi:hypothetical protein
LKLRPQLIDSMRRDFWPVDCLSKPQAMTDLMQIREWVRLAIAGVGALSIFLGYRLFCEMPWAKTRGVLFVSGVAGALLALFGMGILSADLRGLHAERGSETRPAAHHAKPAGEGSFAKPGAGKHRSTAWTT